MHEAGRTTADVERKLSEAQREVLSALDFTNHGSPRVSSITREWATPLDIGGGNGSHHSATLAALVKKGLAERKQRGAPDDMIGKPARAVGMSRGSWCYRITEAGRAALAKEADHG